MVAVPYGGQDSRFVTAAADGIRDIMAKAWTVRDEKL